MDKYSALGRALEREASTRIMMSFADVDAVVGGLPPSARKHRAWWSNDSNGSHVQARAWLGAGWQVVNVDIQSARVEFARDT